MKNPYLHTIGRRKTAIARVFLKAGKGELLVNGQAYDKFFTRDVNRRILLQPLVLVERADRYDIRITVVGGGVSGQAGAGRLGIARALIKAEPELRAPLKKAGYLVSDSRNVERKKYGRHKARKRPQFSKR